MCVHVCVFTVDCCGFTHEHKMKIVCQTWYQYMLTAIRIKIMCVCVCAYICVGMCVFGAEEEGEGSFNNQAFIAFCQHCVQVELYMGAHTTGKVGLCECWRRRG